MKKFAFICLAMTIASTGIGCCHHMCGYGGGYQPFSPACPGGNCGIGYQGQGYAPAAAVPVQGYSATTMTAPARMM